MPKFKHHSTQLEPITVEQVLLLPSEESASTHLFINPWGRGSPISLFVRDPLTVLVYKDGRLVARLGPDHVIFRGNKRYSLLAAHLGRPSSFVGKDNHESVRTASRGKEGRKES